MNKVTIGDPMESAERLKMQTSREEIAEIKTGKSAIEKTVDTLKSRLGNRPLVLYGAARLGKEALGLCRERGIKVTAFCDRAVTGRHEGIEIVDPETLKNRFPDALVLVCSYDYCIGIYDDLRQLGFPTERIVVPQDWALQLNLLFRERKYPGCPVRGLEYRSCPMIEKSALTFIGRIDTDGPCMAMCCESIDGVPAIAFGESARDSVENFRRMRAELIAESVRFELLGDTDEPRKFTAGCVECANFQRGDFGKFDGLIHSISLSMYPAPCQCRCVFCGFIGQQEFMRLNKRLHAKYYEKMFDAIDYAETAGYIASDAGWGVSSGEITIHPYKKRILKLVKNRAATFSTNGFIFDKEIASVLSENPRSAIRVSIDSGTPETWHKVKGVDNFDAVLGNLMKYRDRSRPGQITLKYIVLPGMNDTPTDYRSFVEIMNVLGVKCLKISRDTRYRYTLDAKARETLIRAAGKLVATLYENGMTYEMNMFSYQPLEQARIVAFACELLQAGGGGGGGPVAKLKTRLEG
jgi:wyosine [tRNA(Phe)-imidazoG37] synthetase (radical SAM superfamily)